MNKRDIDTCQHEKLLVLDDDADILSVYDQDDNKKLVVNVCAKCMLLYAEVKTP